MIRLSVKDIRRCYFLNRRRLKEIVSFVLKSRGIRDAALSIIFTTDSKIKRLNYLYRNKNKPTDVLSFSMQEGRPPAAGRKARRRAVRGSPLLGDVVISVDRARVQARRYNSTFEREIYLYIIHGILHLAGYDDEKPSSRKKMQRRELEILKALLRKA